MRRRRGSWLLAEGSSRWILRGAPAARPVGYSRDRSFRRGVSASSAFFALNSSSVRTPFVFQVVAAFRGAAVTSSGFGPAPRAAGAGAGWMAWPIACVIALPIATPVASTGADAGAAAAFAAAIGMLLRPGTACSAACRRPCSCRCARRGSSAAPRAARGSRRRSASSASPRSANVGASARASVRGELIWFAAMSRNGIFDSANASVMRADDRVAQLALEIGDGVALARAADLLMERPSGRRRGRSRCRSARRRTAPNSLSRIVIGCGVPQRWSICSARGEEVDVGLERRLEAACPSA